VNSELLVLGRLETWDLTGDYLSGRWEVARSCLRVTVYYMSLQPCLNRGSLRASRLRRSNTNAVGGNPPPEPITTHAYIPHARMTPT